MTKRILKITACLLILTLIILACYIWLYDASKPYEFDAEINQSHVTDELNRLEPIEGNHELEVMFNKGSKKSLLVIGAAKKRENSIPLNELFSSGSMQYYELNTEPVTSILVDRWHYSH